MATPWMTSDDLISAIKRKIAVPISQNTFSDTDLLAFCNEEMQVSQVPSVLQFHEEYYVYEMTTALENATSRYAIPDRAIGMRLRGLFYVDSLNNAHDMTRINSDDRAFFQANMQSQNSPHRYYIENNDIVLVPTITGDVGGSLLFVYYLRPNQLVASTRAATCTGFKNTITVSNTSLVDGDTVTVGSVTYTAKTSGATGLQFNIGATAILTATNLVAAINTNATYSATNVSGASAVVTVSYTDVTTEFSTSNTTSFTIPTTIGIAVSAVPSNITNSSVVDFLQTKPGHKIKGFDVTVPSNGVSGTVITFNAPDVPTDFIVGDYICSQNECIIPQLPTDLHTGLAERACARILASLGDTEGLQVSAAKIQEINGAQGTLLDNRSDGNPQKILPRKSLLRYGKLGIRSRF